MNRRPRIAEMRAPTAVADPAKRNESFRALPKAGEIASAKKVGWSRADVADADRGCQPGTVAATTRYVCIGFSPRNAPKRAPVGLDDMRPARI
jgi:hypothetical protein